MAWTGSAEAMVGGGRSSMAERGDSCAVFAINLERKLRVALGSEVTRQAWSEKLPKRRQCFPVRLQLQLWLVIEGE